MTDIPSTLIDVVTPLFVILGSGIYILVGLVAFLESVPVIGTFMPGTFIVLFCGFMVSEGYLDFFDTVIAVAIGGVIGDLVGYYFGKHGRRFIHDHKGILRTAHLEMGRGFFSRHGGKSVVLGRFTGPVRSIIPVIAGMIHMRMRRFLSLNIVGALLWALIYIGLGYFFGSQIRLVEKFISRTGLGILIALVAAGGVYFHFRKRDARKTII